MSVPKLIEHGLATLAMVTGTFLIVMGFAGGLSAIAAGGYWAITGEALLHQPRTLGGVSLVAVLAGFMLVLVVEADEA